mmetsp:Transcript_8102/g.23292  ORF Transcript_8102/g.23292 Transcript_8102/m.23292 type:complete len:593 (-) Transcript_8102:99-1877(-)|eukprot:CAMPEP_0119562748 /NCGR_PEP_ID=MMETSP1352-20130426/21399_1 /TAXON_ID=265584 /ORGANISM="Stauroneis constricta, Strain CCMP1120" /LENGTH=592 /DNA_ID=CAMNT_0007611207 /DNA_START=98 /DNA_END=1876 /DNA_ORIENTATION=+
MTLFGYPAATLRILLLMILTGAARTLGVRVFYQLGFDDPLLSTILFILSHALSLLLYVVTDYLDARAVEDDDDNECSARATPQKKTNENRSDDQDDDHQKAAAGSLPLPPSALTRRRRRRRTSSLIVTARHISDAVSALEEDYDEFNHERAAAVPCRKETMASFKRLSSSSRRYSLFLHHKHLDEVDEEENATGTTPHFPHAPEGGTNHAEDSSNSKNRIIAQKRGHHRGSVHGLTEESRRATAWAHRIPWWFQPFLPSMLNVLDTLCRWSSLLFLPASVAEMMIAGSELVLSVFAARFIRKRMVARERWMGVGVVSIGLVIVGASGIVNDAVNSSSGSAESIGATNGDDGTENNSSGGDHGEDDATSSSYSIGLAFVLGKVVMGVLKDLFEEIFMQETEMPAMLLLGMEGCYGLLVSVPLYFLVGPSLGYHPVDSFTRIAESPLNAVYTVFLVLMFLAAGGYQILSTAVTSSMTRNLWKNFRGLVVWTVGMLLFYITSSMASSSSSPSVKDNDDNDDEDGILLGEPWIHPGSYMILIGYVVMILGLKVYYGKMASSSDKDKDAGVPFATGTDKVADDEEAAMEQDETTVAV